MIQIIEFDWNCYSKKENEELFKEMEVLLLFLFIAGLQSNPPWHRAKFEGIVRCPVSGKKVTEPLILDTGHRTLDIGHRALYT